MRPVITNVHLTVAHRAAYWPHISSITEHAKRAAARTGTGTIGCTELGCRSTGARNVGALSI